MSDGVVLRDDEIVALADAPMDDASLPIRVAAAAARDRRADRARDARAAPRRGGRARRSVAAGGARRARRAARAPAHDAIPPFEALDQYGLVVRLLPEWEAGAQPRRSTTRTTASPSTGTCSKPRCRPPRSPIASSRPDLLLIGAWLHDLGKGYPGDHTEVGVELMARIAPRMGFAAARHRRAHPPRARSPAPRRRGDPARHPRSRDVAAGRRRGRRRARRSSCWPRSPKPTRRRPARPRGRRGRRRCSPSSSTASPTCSRARSRRRRPPSSSRGCRRSSTKPTASVLVEGEHDRVVVVAPDRPGLFCHLAGVLALQGLDVLAADVQSSDGRGRGRRVPRAADARRRARLGPLPRQRREGARRPARARSPARRPRPHVQHAARRRRRHRASRPSVTLHNDASGRRVGRRGARRERGRRALPDHARVLRPAARHPARQGADARRRGGRQLLRRRPARREARRRASGSPSCGARCCSSSRASTPEPASRRLRRPRAQRGGARPPTAPSASEHAEHRARAGPVPARRARARRRPRPRRRAPGRVRARRGRARRAPRARAPSARASRRTTSTNQPSDRDHEEDAHPHAQRTHQPVERHRGRRARNRRAHVVEIERPPDRDPDRRARPSSPRSRGSTWPIVRRRCSDSAIAPADREQRSATGSQMPSASSSFVALLGAGEVGRTEQHEPLVERRRPERCRRACTPCVVERRRGPASAIGRRSTATSPLCGRDDRCPCPSSTCTTWSCATRFASSHTRRTALGRQRRRRELDRGVVNALRERRREHVARFGQRVPQQTAVTSTCAYSSSTTARATSSRSAGFSMSGPTARTYESVLSTSARIHTASTDTNSEDAREHDRARPMPIARGARRQVLHRAQDRSGARARTRIIHNVIPKLSLYRSTGAIGVRCTHGIRSALRRRDDDASARRRRVRARRPAHDVLRSQRRRRTRRRRSRCGSRRSARAGSSRSGACRTRRRPGSRPDARRWHTAGSDARWRSRALVDGRLSDPPDRRAGAARRNERSQLLRPLLLQPARLHRRAVHGHRDGAVPQPRDAGRVRVRVLEGQAARAARVEGARRPHGHDRRPVPRRGDRAAAPGARDRASRPSTRSRSTSRGPARSPRSRSRSTSCARTAACMFDSHRFAQTGYWEGTIEVEGETITVTPDRWKGTRDRSWGVRPVGEAEPAGVRGTTPSMAGMWNYAPMQFDDYSLLYIVQEEPTGQPRARGSGAHLERPRARARVARPARVRAHARARHAHDPQAVEAVVPRRAGRRLRRRRSRRCGTRTSRSAPATAWTTTGATACTRARSSCSTSEYDAGGARGVGLVRRRRPRRPLRDEHRRRRLRPARARLLRPVPEVRPRTHATTARPASDSSLESLVVVDEVVFVDDDVPALVALAAQVDQHVAGLDRHLGIERLRQVRGARRTPCSRCVR